MAKPAPAAANRTVDPVIVQSPNETLLIESALLIEAIFFYSSTPNRQSVNLIGSPGVKTDYL